MGFIYSLPPRSLTVSGKNRGTEANRNPRLDGGHPLNVLNMDNGQERKPETEMKSLTVHWFSWYLIRPTKGIATNTGGGGGRVDVEVQYLLLPSWILVPREKFRGK